LVIGPTVGALGFLGYAMGSNSFHSLVACSVVTRVGGAITSVGSGLFLSDMSTPLNRARTMAPLMTTALLGFAIGPAMSGYLAETGDCCWFGVCLSFSFFYYDPRQFADTTNRPKALHQIRIQNKTQHLYPNYGSNC
jgi:MFS family permease